MEQTKNNSVSDYFKFIYQFHTEMERNEFNLVYEGEITHQITKAFTSLAENNMNKEMEDANVKKRVFHVMVECLQNICKHADDVEYIENFTTGNGIFIVGKHEDEYHIITGNKIANHKVEWMTELLNNINTLDKEGLKDLYKSTMKDGKLSNKGGAGLGFIDIARKTGSALEFHFEKIDDDFSFFILKSRISRI